MGSNYLCPLEACLNLHFRPQWVPPIAFHWATSAHPHKYNVGQRSPCVYDDIMHCCASPIDVLLLKVDPCTVLVQCGSKVTLCIQ